MKTLRIVIGIIAIATIAAVLLSWAGRKDIPVDRVTCRSTLMG
ncbi:hypothetical protein [Chitinophaga sp. 212800010-3]|nr:hypothetical protein [Chitinophaga sp. 212800010-3]